MKILIPVDGSKHALKALDYLIEMMREWKDAPRVHLLNVQRPITTGDSKRFVKKKTLEEFYQEESERAMKDAHERLYQAAIDHSQHTRVGRPADAIAEYVKDKGCDQIIMATRGRGDVPSLLLGSTARKVVSLVKVPVTLVK
jgi:nucleotide-binding universal stress UspA family protein